MKFKISDSPSSYLIIDFTKDEKIISEKGCLIYSDGEYNFENKIEAKGYKNLLALLGGKSLTWSCSSSLETFLNRLQRVLKQSSFKGLVVSVNIL